MEAAGKQPVSQARVSNDFGGRRYKTRVESEYVDILSIYLDRYEQKC